MEQILLEMFEQARKLVVETDRKLAEESDRIREKEREAKLLELSTQIEAAFDFTSKEKLELDPRLDIQDGKPTVEFIVRSLRAIFVLSPQPEGHWTLSALEDGRSPSSLGEFQGGTKGDAASRRLAASPHRDSDWQLCAKRSASPREKAGAIGNLQPVARHGGTP